MIALYLFRTVLIFGSIHLAISKSTCTKDTPWRSGSGKPIRKYLEGIQVTDSIPNGLLVVEEEGLVDMVKSNHHFDALTWQRHGYFKNDGWLYGVFSDQNLSSGQNLVFVYPDFQTALVGNFSEFEMQSSAAVSIVGHRCHRGFLEIIHSPPDPLGFRFKWEPVTHDFVTSSPKVRDPLEARNIYINTTSLPKSTSDGVFAKRTIENGTIVAYFAGAYLHYQSRNSSLIMGKMDNQARMQALGTRKGISNDTYIFVPEVDFAKYRATLGHKIRHNFEYNAIETHVIHPRFGFIRGYESVQIIPRGEEILGPMRLVNTGEILSRSGLKSM